MCINQTKPWILSRHSSTLPGRCQAWTSCKSRQHQLPLSSSSNCRFALDQVSYAAVARRQVELTVKWLRVRVHAEEQLPRERRGTPIWQRAVLCHRLGAAFRSLQMHHHHCRCSTLSIAAQHNTNERCLKLAPHNTAGRRRNHGYALHPRALMMTPSPRACTARASAASHAHMRKNSAPSSRWDPRASMAMPSRA